MSFYQRFGLAGALAGIGIVADGLPWIGYVIMLFSLSLLIFDGDTPGRVRSKWYGVTKGGLAGPFPKANEAGAGYYGVKPEAVIQVFGTGGWADKVGVILHPISQPPATEYAEDEQGNLYRVSTEPFEPESN